MRCVSRNQTGRFRRLVGRALVAASATGLLVAAVVPATAIPSAALSHSSVSLGAPLNGVPAGELRADPFDVPSASDFKPAPVEELVVKYAQGAPVEQKDGLATGSDVLGKAAEKGNRLDDGFRTIELPKPVSEAKAERLSQKILEDPQVVSAEPNLRVFPAQGGGPVATPNDPYYEDQWSLWSNGSLTSEDDSKIVGINARYGWVQEPGSSASPTIAVLDTGSTSHPDLNGRWVAGYDMVSSASRARDGNARDANPADEGDWNSDPDACEIDSSSWHGTHVAGTIGATRNNELGISGIVDDAKIQAVRVLAQCGGNGADIADGITWASGGSVSHLPVNATPAKVINMSLGGVGNCPSYVQTAIDAATARGSTIVVAAGNSDISASSFFPANCRDVVTVAAIGPYGSRASYSNYGSAVDLAAPGGNRDFGYQSMVLSTLNTGTTEPEDPDYAWYQGTSMATPHVAGAVALYLTYQPSATPSEVEAALKSSSSTFMQNSAFGNYRCNAQFSCGTGALDLAALLDVVTPPSGVVAALAGVYDSTTIGVTFTPPSGGATSYSATALSNDEQILGESAFDGTTGYVTVANTDDVDSVVISARDSLGSGVSQSVEITGYVPAAPAGEPSTLPTSPTNTTPTKTKQEIGSVKRKLKRGRVLRISKLTDSGQPLTVVSKKKRICLVKQGKKKWKVKGKRVGICKLKLRAPANAEVKKLKTKLRVRVK